MTLKLVTNQQPTTTNNNQQQPTTTDNNYRFFNFCYIYKYLKIVL